MIIVIIVGTRGWSDCSLVPLEKEEERSKVMIQVEKEVEEDKKVESLWVCVVDKETGRKWELETDQLVVQVRYSGAESDIRLGEEKIFINRCLCSATKVCCGRGQRK